MKTKGPIKVLIIDDEEDFVESIGEILASRGFLIERAYDAQQAIARDLEFRPDISLIDLRLRQTSGLELIQRLQHNNPHLVTILMTAYAEVDTAISAIQEGVYDYIRKPFAIPDLLNTLSRASDYVRLQQSNRLAEEELRLKNSELEEVNRRLRTILESSKIITGSLTMNQIAERILTEMARNLNAEKGWVCLQCGNEWQIIAQTKGSKNLPMSFPSQTCQDLFARIQALGEEALLIDLTQGLAGLECLKPHLPHTGSLFAFSFRIDPDYSLMTMIYRGTGSPFDEQDRETGLILTSFSREVARSVVATESLRESEKQFRSISEQLLMSILVIQDGMIRYVNNAFIKLIGYSQHELYSFKPYEFAKLIYKDDIDFLIDQLKMMQSRKLDEGPRQQFRGYTRSGQVIWCELYLNSIQYQGRNAVLVTLIDITQRKDAEEALIQSEARYRMITRNVSDVIWTVQLDLSLNYVSPSIENLLGYTSEESITMPIQDFLFDESARKVLAVYSEAMEREKVEPGSIEARLLEVEFKHKNGSSVWTEIKTSFLRDDLGNPLAIMGVTRDISKRKQLEEERNQLKAKLHEAQRLEEVAHLSSIVAHEIRNPIFAISSGIQVLQKSLNINREQNRSLDIIFNEILRVNRLIEQLVIYGGLKEYRFEQHNLVELIEEINSLYEPVLHSRHVSLEKRLPTPQQLMVNIDRDKVIQVLVNLYQNAIDLSPQGTTISVAVFPDEKARHAFFTISDQGPGISPANLQRVFDLFFTTKKNGSGMGLAVSRKIMLDHGGSIEIESVQGKGAKVIVGFSLPNRPSSPDSGPESLPPHPAPTA
ncbi:PAS domain S-box protein [bacterium]|nr:PAS domain S-box protein [bacterium]